MVTPKERAVYEAVLERDRMMFWEFLKEGARQRSLPFNLSLPEWQMQAHWVCMAPVIDFSQWDRCSGEMERDHVHSHTGGTKGKRATTDMDHLVILCHHHHQDGWATSHRPEIRTYIKEANERYRDRSGRPLP